MVNEAFAAEKPRLGALPLASFRSNWNGGSPMKGSVGGNLYSILDATRKRIVEVHTLANEVQIFEDDTLIATHPGPRWPQAIKISVVSLWNVKRKLGSFCEKKQIQSKVD